MTLPLAADLHALAKALKHDARYARVGPWLKAAELAQACLSDLRQAEACCEALGVIISSFRGRGSLKRLTTENSLLFTGVVFYARATATAGKRGERGSIQLHDSFTPEQNADHQWLKDMRDQVVAHSYPGRTVGGQVWSNSASLLVDTGKGWRPAIIARSAAFDRATFDVLQRQVPVASALMLQRFNRNVQRITDLFREHPISQATILAQLVDPVVALGTEDRARHALESASSEGQGTALYHD